MHFLADIADASGQGIKDTLLVIGTLLGLAGGVFALLRKQPVLPQPLETKERERFATAKGVEKLSDEVKSLTQQVHSLAMLMQGKETEITKHVNGEVAAIHKRLDPVIQGLEHMLGEWEAFQRMQKK